MSGSVSHLPPFDRNERKAIGGRFDLRVACIDGLQLGTSAPWGGGSGEARRDRALRGRALRARRAMPTNFHPIESPVRDAHPTQGGTR